MAKALEIIGLSKSFGTLEVLREISIDVEQGEFVSIVGPSGSGKTTLFHLVGGLLAPDSGKISLSGKDVIGQRGNIGYMPQQPALLPWRTVLDNVVLGREIAGQGKKESRAIALDGLTKIGLADFANAYPDTLSGGMRQRVAFLRALLTDHDLLCLDEPFSALDAMTRAEMQRWLLEIWETTAKNRAILFVTHNIEEALLLSSAVYVLGARPATVLERVEVPFARPRPAEIVDDPEFIRLRRHITNSLA
jgi:ABC-type nitrate/sulfonate/bicarbonate transport system ATPase subunit